MESRDGVRLRPGSEYFLAALLGVGCLTGKNPGLPPQKPLHRTVASTEAGREEDTLCIPSLGSAVLAGNYKLRGQPDRFLAQSYASHGNEPMEHKAWPLEF